MYSIPDYYCHYYSHVQYLWLLSVLPCALSLGCPKLLPRTLTVDSISGYCSHLQYPWLLFPCTVSLVTAPMYSIPGLSLAVLRVDHLIKFQLCAHIVWHARLANCSKWSSCTPSTLHCSTAITGPSMYLASYSVFKETWWSLMKISSN